MRAKAIILGAIACVMVCATSVMAEDNASTSELPAALQELGVDNDLILTNDQADEVRGEAFLLNFNFSFNGGGVAVNLSNNPVFPLNTNAAIVAVNSGGVFFNLQ